MPDFTVARRGTDSSGRGIFATAYMWNWFHDDVLTGVPFGDKVVITQGAFMPMAGGGAAGSAGYHDLGGCFDLRVWNLTDDEVGQMVRRLRSCGAAAWLRNPQHGGFTDPHIHMVLGTDHPLTGGAAFQWSEYLAGRDGLAGRGEDYHWRPDPLVTTPPKDWFSMATKDELAQVLRDVVPDLVREELKKAPQTIRFTNPAETGKRSALPWDDLMSRLYAKVGKK